jgi:hypothetical protein
MQALGKNGAGVKVGVTIWGSRPPPPNPRAIAVKPVSSTTPNRHRRIDHGTNVAEIVYEMAPGADVSGENHLTCNCSRR